MELMRIRQRADQQVPRVKEPMYILAGVSSKTIEANVLSELRNKYNIEFKFDKWGNFTLFGVKVIMAYTGSIAGLGAIRGVTAWGAYVNEASLAVQAVFIEIIQRCSAPESHIICDTNPDNPEHYLKKEFIDKSISGKSPDILQFQFRLDDNTFLDPGYVRHLKESEPSGMFYDRNIEGRWVTGEGVVYKDFDEQTMVEQHLDMPPGSTVYCGVDWGYEHKGCIVVMADDTNGNTIMLEEHTRQHEEIDYWVRVARDIQSRYGHRIPFFADSARPEHVARFIHEDINCDYANKARLSGVEEVASLMKQGHFFVSRDTADKFFDEIYNYVWDEKSGEPVKLNDDVMDAVRYAIYTKHHVGAEVTTRPQ